MKGCLKIGLYVLGGIIALLVVAAIVSPKSSSTRQATEAAPTAEAMPTEIPEWMAPAFKEICGSNSELTEIQQEKKVKRMTGKKVVGWEGAIYDVRHDGDKYMVSVNMDPGGIIRARQVEIPGLGADVAALKVDQRIVFSGTIQKIDVTFGVVCNPMVLTEATVKAK
jgi:hypothetical protein